MSIEFQVSHVMSVPPAHARRLALLFGRPPPGRGEAEWSNEERAALREIRAGVADAMDLFDDGPEGRAERAAFLDADGHLPHAYRLLVTPVLLTVSCDCAESSQAVELCAHLLAAWLEDVGSDARIGFTWGGNGHGGLVFVARGCVVMDNPDAWFDAVRSDYDAGGPEAAMAWESGEALEELREARGALADAKRTAARNRPEPARKRRRPFQLPRGLRPR